MKKLFLPALSVAPLALCSAFAAADSGPFVGTVDLTTGVVTPIVTGLGSPEEYGVRRHFQALDDSDDKDSCHKDDQIRTDLPRSDHHPLRRTTLDGLRQSQSRTTNNICRTE